MLSAGSDADAGSSTDEYDYELSDDDESEWEKQVPLLPALSFDSIGIMQSQPFLLSGGLMEYFNKFLDDEVYDMLVYQTNLYAVQQNILTGIIFYFI